MTFDKNNKRKNLIGLRLCEHDSNISYYDGKEFYYYKSERNYQIKHHAFDNFWQWKNIIFNLWNLKEKDIDDIAIIIDPWRHNLPLNNEDFFPSIDNYPYLPFKAIRLNHHYAHALSTDVMHDDISGHVIIDGYGDQDQALTVFKKDKIVEKFKLSQKGSLGQLYSITAERYFDIKGNTYDTAGKLMGLQSYGKLDQNFYKQLDKYTFEDYKNIWDPINYVNYKDSELLANLEKLSWIRTVHEKTGKLLINFFKKFFENNDYIGYSGGVAQNVVWNTELKNHFPNLQIMPYCNDEGLSIGAVEFLRRKHELKKPIINNFPFNQSDEAPSFQPSEKTIKKIAQHLANNKIIAWYQGLGEVGPRALGNRSLLFNPFNKNAKNIVNKVKRREAYRPFGASVLKEDINKYLINPIDNPHMLYVAKVKKPNLYGITHVDNTCRYQTVDQKNKYFYKLLKEFKKITGESIILNTSLNIGGKPIMSNKRDLLWFLNNSDIDYAVYGDEIIN
tara:strand:- start:2242 stop:3753 length:1512 start_codon:yes stop_codon:yes gene_type:complete